MKSLFPAVIATCLAPALVAAANESSLAPKPSEPMALEGSYDFKKKEQKHRRSLSGFACLSPDNCVAAFDEGREARRAALSPAGYKAGAAVALPIDGKEGDAEGAAAEGGRLFVTGSHSVKRSDCDDNDASRFVARIEPDGRVTRGNLLPAIEAVPELKTALGKCLDAGGLDIEGVAASGGHLWFGFRGPAAATGAYVLRVEADAVFAGGDLKPKTFVAEVGPGRTIRDMQAVGDRLLLLAGPPKGVDHEAGYALVLFDPAALKNGSTVLGRLDFSAVAPRTLSGCADEPMMKDVKPEAVMVPDPKSRPWKVAILSDGLCDGGPLWIEIP